MKILVHYVFRCESKFYISTCETNVKMCVVLVVPYTKVTAGSLDRNGAIVKPVSDCVETAPVHTILKSKILGHHWCFFYNIPEFGFESESDLANIKLK